MRIFISGDTEAGPIVDMADMKEGDVGVVVSSQFDYEDQIVLCSYSRIVSLSRPEHCWERVVGGFRNTNKVRLFPTETVLTVIT